MRLRKIRIENFRSFDDETIDLDEYTCLVGPNGSGKSAVLTALNVFFRNNAATSTDVHRLSAEDFHLKNTQRPVRITLTFTDLGEQAQTDFSLYYRHGQLVVFAEATWDGAGAEVEQHGSRLVMRAFARFFEAESKGLRVGELREIYGELRNEYPHLPSASTKPAMLAALRAHEESHPELCESLPEPNLFYGWSRAANLLEKHIQWVYIPAVKDAATEQEEGTKTALGQLLMRTIRTEVDFGEPFADLQKQVAGRYKEIIDQQQEALTGLQLAIERRLRDWTSEDARLLLQWRYDPGKSVVINQPNARVSLGEEMFMGEVPRLGHGMQRAFLISILQELAIRRTDTGPMLLLGFEEPELYQHPPQAQHIADLLAGLAGDAGKRTQVLVTSHSPYFVPARGFPSVRMVRKSRKLGSTTVAGATYEQVANVIADAMGERPRPPSALMATVGQILRPGQRELFFSRVPVIVEGPEDVAFISTHMHLTGKWTEFRRLGCHFVAADGKRSISRLLAIANELSIPAFVVFDADADETSASQLMEHKRDNSCILELCGASAADPLPRAPYCGDNVVMWHTRIRDVLREELGSEEWDQAQATARERNQLTVGVRPKNAMLVAATLEELDKRGERLSLLDNLCDAVLTFAGSVG